jgi:chromatin remodeling complex protein RSC6
MRSMNAAAVAYALWKYIYAPPSQVTDFPLHRSKNEKNKKINVYIYLKLYTVTFGPSVTN